MLERLERLIADLRDCVPSIDAARMRADEAEKMVALLAEGERLCQAGRAIASHRVLRTKFWRTQGFRTPAQWLSARTKTTLGEAISAVETAHRLREFPATRAAFIAGELSETQAAAITAAAATDPGSEADLLSVAANETVTALRDRCRDVQAAAVGDEDACERIRRGRFLRHWNDRDGAVRLDARLAPDDGARILAVVGARADQMEAEARRSGHRELIEAYAADALIELSTGGAAPKTVVHVHVDQAALDRGHTIPGERCRIDGVGPVPVSAARRLITDGVIKAIASEGADVRAVAHLGRAIPAKIRTALEARDVTCVVPSCEVRSGLEIDHVVPFARGGTTALDNLARLCRFHHAQKTHRGWRLGGGPGDWTWTRGGDGTAPSRAAPSDSSTTPARAP